MKNKISEKFLISTRFALTLIILANFFVPTFVAASGLSSIKNAISSIIEKVNVYVKQTSIESQEKYWSVNNAPVLYGTSSIKVPVGTKIDYKHDARFRVFAKDNEDGDITADIEATDNFTTDYDKKVGKYTISYSVTDNHGNKSTLEVPVEIRESSEIELEKIMYSLPSVDHLNTLGYTRGNNMDRQTIGIFVEAGASFEIKKNSTNNMTVKLERNDSLQESQKILNINDEWTTIKNVITNNGEEFYYDTVPNIKTLYKEPKEVTYTVKWDSNDSRIKPLHYYHEGDGEDYQKIFLDEWESDEGSYAIVDGLSMMVLIPYQDHDHVFYNKYPYMKPYYSFEHFFNWWNDVMDEYDEMIGLSYRPEDSYNQNVKTKYFVKPNAHGAGAAYYNSSDHVGINSTSDWSIFQVGWGNLHEVGHGYQGNLGGGGLGMPLGEVGVNIFGYYIQDVANKFIYDESWLNIKGKENNYNSSRLQGLGYSDSGSDNIGAASMLYSLVNALDYFEDFSGKSTATHKYKEAYAYVNTYFRKHYYETGEKLKTADAWALALAEKYDVNFVLYFESWGVKVSDYVKEKLMATDAELVYYLRDLVGDDATALRIKPDSNIGIYDLVTTSELQELSSDSITGNVELEFKIDDLSQILGKTLYIADGNNIKKFKLTEETLKDSKLLVNLNAGAYRVAVPKPNGVYDFDNIYILIQKGVTNHYDITYEAITDISFGNDVIIKSRGYWGVDYNPFIVQVVGNRLEFTYKDTYPNSGSWDNKTLFASLNVYDNLDNLIYTKSVNGGYYSTFGNGVDYVDIKAGYKLKIYYLGNKHYETTDLSFYSSLTGEKLVDYGITDTKTHERTYVVTEYGLIPEDMLGGIYPSTIPDSVYDMYKERLDTYIEAYKEGKTQRKLLDPFSPNKGSNIIKNALKNLNNRDKAIYNEKLKSISTGDAPVIKVGKNNEMSYVFDLANSTHPTIEDVYDMVEVADTEDGTIFEDGKITVSAKDKGASVTIESDVNWEKVGTYHVTITATDSHDNITVSTLEVLLIDTNDDSLIDISNFDVTIDGIEVDNGGNGFVIYTGEKFTPSVTVTDKKGHVLTEGTDYKIAYGKNTDVGTATITITATQNEIENGTVYKGSINVNFEIKKAKPAEIPESILIVEYDIDNLDDINLPSGWYFKDKSASLEFGDNELVVIYDGDKNHEAMTITIVVTRKEKWDGNITPGNSKPPEENPDAPLIDSSDKPWGKDNPNHGGDFNDDPANDVGPNEDGDGKAKDDPSNDNKDDNDKNTSNGSNSSNGNNRQNNGYVKPQSSPASSSPSSNDNKLDGDDNKSNNDNSCHNNENKDNDDKYTDNDNKNKDNDNSSCVEQTNIPIVNYIPVLSLSFIALSICIYMIRKLCNMED